MINTGPVKMLTRREFLFHFNNNEGYSISDEDPYVLIEMENDEIADVVINKKDRVMSLLEEWELNSIVASEVSRLDKEYKTYDKLKEAFAYHLTPFMPEDTARKVSLDLLREAKEVL